MDAEREDTNGEVDFLSVRVTIGEEQPVSNKNDLHHAIGKTKVSKKRNRESLENIVDNCISKLQKENNASGNHENAKKSHSKVWIKKKEPDRKTYSRRTRGGLDTGSESPVYSGEEVSGDEEFWRRGKLPLLMADSREEKVDRWLVEVTPNSQPSPNQRTVSTPLGEKTPDRKFVGEKEVNLSDLSPFTSHPLSPLDLNVAGNRRVSMEDTVIISQGMQSSCPVEVNDTFDKMVLNGKNKKKPQDQEHEIVCSQVSSSSMPPLISPSVAMNVLKTLETSAESDDLSDLEGVKGIGKLGDTVQSKPSQGWNKVQMTFNNTSKTSVKKTKRKSKIGSLEFLEHDAKDTKGNIEPKQNKIDPGKFWCTVRGSKAFGPRRSAQGKLTQTTLHQGNSTQ